MAFSPSTWSPDALNGLPSERLLMNPGQAPPHWLVAANGIIAVRTAHPAFPVR
jgi:hypothetical protein